MLNKIFKKKRSNRRPCLPNLNYSVKLLINGKCCHIFTNIIKVVKFMNLVLVKIRLKLMAVKSDSHYTWTAKDGVGKGSLC